MQPLNRDTIVPRTIMDQAEIIRRANIEAAMTTANMAATLARRPVSPAGAKLALASRYRRCRSNRDADLFARRWCAATDTDPLHGRCLATRSSLHRARRRPGYRAGRDRRDRWLLVRLDRAAGAATASGTLTRRIHLTRNGLRLTACGLIAATVGSDAPARQTRRPGGLEPLQARRP